LYGYVGNDPVNAVDPDGKDVLYVNDSGAVEGNGHSAFAVGTDPNGWTYYSKNGYGAGNNVLLQFLTLATFTQSDAASRYNRALYLSTSSEQDTAIMRYANSNYKTDYNVLTNNCGDLVNQSLNAGNIRGAGVTFLGITRPNGQYDELSTRVGWGIFSLKLK
jgi:hypothetical protein